MHLLPGKDPEMVENPAYSVPKITQSHRRADLSRVVMQTESRVQEEEEEQIKTGESSKWDHHITLAVVITLVSLLLLNPLSFALGLCGIFFAYKVLLMTMHFLHLSRFSGTTSIKGKQISLKG